jgi:ketosteroid isomerase-like protein
VDALIVLGGVEFTTKRQYDVTFLQDIPLPVSLIGLIRDPDDGADGDPREDQMAHPNENLVREGFAAFQKGDLFTLRYQVFADDIRYHIPGWSPIAGDHESTAQVIQLFTRLFELSGATFRIDLHDVVVNDEHAAALFIIRTTSSAHTGGELRCLSRLPRGVPHIGELLHIYGSFSPGLGFSS